MALLIFIIILLVLIIAHEFGHFIVAKLLRMRVDEFGIGFPPKLWGWRLKGSDTEYSINALPFGGFVKIFGENPAERMTEEERRAGFTRKPKLHQAAVIVAGVTFNILLAWVLIGAGFLAGLPTPVGTEPAGTVVKNPELTVTSVLADSPAAQAGFKPGDRIHAVSANGMAPPEVIPDEVSSFIAAHGDEKLDFTLLRAEDEITVSAIPSRGLVEDRAAIGITMDLIGTLKLPVHQALWESAKMTGGLFVAITKAFTGLVRDAIFGKAQLDSLTGPVGIVGLVGEATKFGFIYLLTFTAFISINLAVINLVPFPALDGGRLLFLLIEAVKGSPIKPFVANALNTVGFALLIALMILVTYGDIVRLLA